MCPSSMLFMGPYGKRMSRQSELARVNREIKIAKELVCDSTHVIFPHRQ